MHSIPHTNTKARRLVVLSAGALMLATLSGGLVSQADAASIRLDPASRYFQSETVEVTKVAIKNKFQAQQHLAKIKRLTQKLKRESAKLKAATAKVKRITATLR